MRAETRQIGTLFSAIVGEEDGPHIAFHLSHLGYSIMHGKVSGETVKALITAMLALRVRICSDDETVEEIAKIARESSDMEAVAATMATHVY